jgi:hypothetical protein
LEREKILKLLREKGDKILNINNLFEIRIPENIEIASIDQYFLLDYDNTQYGVENLLRIVYENKFFFIGIQIYGNKDSFFTEEKTYDLKKIVNPSPYMSKNQVKYLKENYLNDPFTNMNKIKISRFISNWGTSFTSDYYGLYFKIPNNQFDECVISIDNIWGTFAKNEILDEDYKEKIAKEGGTLEKIFKDLEIIENSITFTLSDDSIKIGNGCAGTGIIENNYIYPTIADLRMRSRPSLDGEVLGYMKNAMYRVVVTGEKAVIDGIEGDWIMITSLSGNDAAWVFSGFTRKATGEEYDYYFGW